MSTSVEQWGRSMNTKVTGCLALVAIVMGCSGEGDLAEGDQTNTQKYVGTDQPDALIGTDADEIFLGLEGLDRIEGHGGDDVLDGGPGGDALLGGGGDDTYVYNLGDEGDIIQDSAGSKDVIRFGAGIHTDSLTITERPGLLHVVVGNPASKDQFLIHKWGVFDNFIESFVFEDGTVLGITDIEGKIEGNRRPKVLRPIQDQIAIADRSFRFEIPGDTYRDPEGEIIQVSARSVDSRLLRDGWLSFDNGTQAFYGTPGKQDIGETQIEVTLSDPGSLTSKVSFRIKVVPED